MMKTCARYDCNQAFLPRTATQKFCTLRCCDTTNKRLTRKAKLSAERLTALDVLSILHMCNGSGHDIFPPKELIDKGVPKWIVRKNTHVLKSDMRNPKSMIFVDGHPVKRLTGVHTLNLYTDTCNHLHLNYEMKGGRGFQARVCHGVLVAWAQKEVKKLGFILTDEREMRNV